MLFYGDFTTFLQNVSWGALLKYVNHNIGTQRTKYIKYSLRKQKGQGLVWKTDFLGKK